VTSNRSGGVSDMVNMKVTPSLPPPSISAEELGSVRAS
jgi:hypothetical protein